jgi:hypothetical protein
MQLMSVNTPQVLLHALFARRIFAGLTHRGKRHQ